MTAGAAVAPVAAAAVVASAAGDAALFTGVVGAGGRAPLPLLRRLLGEAASSTLEEEFVPILNVFLIRFLLLCLRFLQRKLVVIEVLIQRS